MLRKYCSIGRFCLVACLFLLLSSGAQAQSNTEETISSTTNWELEVNVCFDKYGYPLPNKLSDLVERLKTEQERLRQTHQDPQYLLNCLAYVYENQGEWDLANQTVGEILAFERTHSNPHSLYLNQSLYYQARITDVRLLGIYAMQGKWTDALIVYARSICLDGVHTLLPVICLCWGWLALWCLPGGLPITDRLQAGTIRPLLILGLIPFYFFVWQCVMFPFTCFLITGNAGAFLFDRHISILLHHIYQIELAVVMIAVTLIARKRTGFERGLTEETFISINEPADPLVPVRNVRLYVSFIAMLICLTFIDVLTGDFWLVKSLMHLPAAWRQFQEQNGYWFYTLFVFGFLSSWAQELLFRSLTQRLAHRAGGLGFGIVYTSLVFAGMHLQLDRFVELFWIGLIFATLYEITHSIRVCAIIHATHNIFVFISYPIKALFGLQ